MKRHLSVFIIAALAAIAILAASFPLRAAQTAQIIPVGTFLPVMLNTNLDSDKSKVGEKIEAKLRQDVDLPDRATLKTGSELYGHIVSVKRGAPGAKAQVSFVIDHVKMNGKVYPITTSLRAAASMMAVYQARQPINPVAMDGSSVWDYNTRQIGGDIVYGRKDVRSGDGSVGMSPEPGAVIAVPRANPDAGCPAMDQKTLQSFWLFSTSACGVYGDEDADMQIARQPAGNKNGDITLTAPKRVLLRGGGGLLLVVEPQPAAQSVP